MTVGAAMHCNSSTWNKKTRQPVTLVVGTGGARRPLSGGVGGREDVACLLWWASGIVNTQQCGSESTLPLYCPDQEAKRFTWQGGLLLSRLLVFVPQEWMGTGNRGYWFVTNKLVWWTKPSSSAGMCSRHTEPIPAIACDCECRVQIMSEDTESLRTLCHLSFWQSQSDLSDFTQTSGLPSGKLSEVRVLLPWHLPMTAPCTWSLPWPHGHWEDPPLDSPHLSYFASVHPCSVWNFLSKETCFFQ